MEKKLAERKKEFTERAKQKEENKAAAAAM